MTRKLHPSEYSTVQTQNFASLPLLIGILFFFLPSAIFAQTDAGIAFIEPLTAICPGNYPVQATVQNYGNTQINTVTVNWSVDGVVQSPVTHTSPLDTAGGSTGSPTGLVTLGNYSFSTGQSYDLKVWTSNPNSSADALNANDTAMAALALQNEPSGLSVSNRTINSADISFDTASSTAYSIIYGPKGFDPDTGGSGVSSIFPPYTLSGLSSATYYDIYIYADCGSGIYSDTAGPVSFSTLCPTQPLPFTENFNAGMGCFQVIDGGSSTHTWKHFPSGGLFGFNIDNTPYMGTDIDPATFGIGDAFDERLLSPVIDAGNVNPGEYLLLEFGMSFYSQGSAPDSAIVEVYDGSQWHMVYRNLDNTGTLVDITAYANSDLQIRFIYRKDANELGLWIVDNISVSKVSCSEIDSQTVNISGITQYSANISFDTSSSAAHYSVVYGPQGFDPDTGGSVLNFSPPYDLTGLSPGTAYDLYMYADCSGIHSEPIGPISFSTLSCSAPHTLPFTEDFNAGMGCFQVIDGGSSTHTWKHFPASGIPPEDIFDIDNTPFIGSEVDVLTYGVGDVFDEMLISPVIQAGNLNSGEYLALAFSMQFNSLGYAPDSAIVEVYSGSQWHTVYRNIDDSDDGGDDKLIDITAYANDSLQIRFTYRKDADELLIWSVDNISVTKILCPELHPDLNKTLELSGITHQSVDVFINDHVLAGDVAGFSYELDTAGFSPGTGRFTGILSNPGTISGLNPLTTYDLYVKNDCGSNGASERKGRFRFTTRCPLSQQIAGTYTIDPGSPTSGSNFSSFPEATDVLNSCGIKGPVIFNVAPGTYTDSISLTKIAGTDSVNTITFRGDSPSNTIITYYHPYSISTSVGRGHPTIYLNNTDHITFRNFTIENTNYTNGCDTNTSENPCPLAAQHSFAIYIQNSSNDYTAIDYITIDSCNIKLPLVHTRVDPTLVGIAASGSAYRGGRVSVATDKYTVEHFTLTNSTITGGQTGVKLPVGNANGNAIGTDYVIENNVFRNNWESAIEVTGASNISIKGNDIDSVSGRRAVELQMVSNFDISGNKIFAGPLSYYTTQEALSIFRSNDGTGELRRSRIVNNIIASPNHAGVGLDYSMHDTQGLDVDISHNTIMGVKAAAAIDMGGKMDVRNNIFYCHSLGTTGNNSSSVYFYFSPDSNDIVDHNLYYNANDEDYLIQAGPVSYPDLQSWQEADTLFNAHSLEGDPLFDSIIDYNFYPTGFLPHNTGDNSVGITTDLDGNVRPLDIAVDMGAYEFTPDPCPDIARFIVEDQTLDGGTFSFDRDGDTYKLEYGPCGYSQGTGTTITGVSPMTVTGLNPGTCYDLYVQRDCGNGTYSNLAGPYTFVITECPDSLKLSGTYTIDNRKMTGNRNFGTFGEVAYILNTCGIQGPVLFEVAGGTYQENLALEVIPGASEVNTVTFRGSGTSNTELSLNASPGIPTVYLHGTDYVTFKNMTIANRTLNGAYGVFLQNGADHNTIDSCRIELRVLAGNAIAILATDALNSQGNSNSHYFTISNSEIIGGEVGMHLHGSSDSSQANVGHIIKNNVFRKQYNAGMRVRGMNDITVKGNDIDSMSTIGRGYGMSFRDLFNYQISENRIVISAYGNPNFPPYGLAINGNAGVNVTNRSRIVNNMVIFVSENEEGVGMTLGSGITKTDVFHNSILTNAAPAVNISFFDLTTVSILNNIFISGTSFALETNGGSPFGTAPGTLDYNLYYSDSSLFNISSTIYNDLSAWQAAFPISAAHSWEGYTQFVDPLSDLHIVQSPLAYQNGDPSAGVTTDIDGDTRSMTAPSIGADEFTPPFCRPSYKLEVVEVFADSVRLNWYPGAGSTYNLWYGAPGFFNDSTITGNKVTGISDTIFTLSGLSPRTDYEIWVSDYCGNSTGSSTGDTSAWFSWTSFRTECAAGLSGAYTIDAAIPSGGTNFKSFASAAEYLMECGVDGPVVFNVAAGAYEENLILPEISGASPVNTITFRGTASDPSGTILTDSASGGVSTVYLNGADYIVFQNMTIANGGLNVARAVLLQNEAEYNTIDSCHIKVPDTWLAGSSQIVGILAPDLYSPTAKVGAHHLTVSNSRIIGGKSGITLQGSRDNNNEHGVGHIIKNNVFRDMEMPVLAVRVSDIKVVGNDISNATGNFENLINLQTSDNFEISGNKIMSSGNSGIGVTQSNQGANVTAHSLIANNIIVISSGGFGIFLYDVPKTDVYYNSIAVGSGSTSGSGNAIQVQIAGVNKLNIRNNIFYANKGHALSLYGNIDNSTVIDYNLYYSNSTTFGGNNTYADLPAWQAADPTRNIHSIEGDPQFISPSNNLHIRHTSIAIDSGDASVGILEDIDGDIRPNPASIGVDIGADEFYFGCEFTLSGSMAATAIGCDSALLNWSPGIPGSYSVIEYGTTGFVPGNGNMTFGGGAVTLHNLEPGTMYDVYISDTCGTDTIAPAGPASFTTPSGPIMAAYTYTANPATFTSLMVDFDATSSTGASSYSWDFDDGSQGSGEMISHTYTANGTYIVQLLIEGACGMDTITDTVIVRGISLEENLLDNSLRVYPNPFEDKVQIHFKTHSSEDAVIRLSDLSGKVILEKTISHINGRYEGELDLSHLAKGSYMLQVESGKMKGVKRIIRQ